MEPLMKILALCRENPQPCIVCDGPPVSQGLMEVNDNYRIAFGVPPGKTRTIAFFTCEEHRPDTPDARTICERAILQKFRAGARKLNIDIQ